MSIYSSPPPARLFRDDKASLLVCWWCTIFAAVIIIFRVCGRYVRTEKLFKEDWLAVACIVPLFARMAAVHIILLFGTNNTSTIGLSDEDIRRREIGSKLVLVSRVFYAATIWMLKLTITEFFKRLTINIWTSSHERILKAIRYFLLATFIATIVANLAECQPFSQYWQVSPDPGAKCRQGYAQLLTMGICDVITDILLVVFPIPIVLSSKMGAKKKAQLVLLFAGSLLPAGTTLYRMLNILEKHGSQQYRSLMASVEILFAAAVANALILGSFVRDRGVKKQRWKFGSMSDSVERSTSRRGTVIQHWGSDEDLVRDLGLGVDPELREATPTPRPAPMASVGNSAVKARKLITADWQFPGERSDTSEESDLMKNGEPHSPGDTSSIMTPRKVSFFDIGGLLDEDGPRRLSSTRTADTDGESSMFSPLFTRWSHEQGSSQPPQQKGSMALLQDVGGLLGPKRERDRVSGRGYELQTIPPDQSPDPRPINVTRPPTHHPLQDVGGLLR
ncbi:pth11-like integral membrane protein [Diplocarpon rosae]|nr:pth11-like integral membrane protein [Diplocarpon rosae]